MMIRPEVLSLKFEFKDRVIVELSTGSQAGLIGRHVQPLIGNGYLNPIDNNKYFILLKQPDGILSINWDHIISIREA